MTDDCPLKKPVVQCKTCPWRVDCEPMTDIPNYRPELHVGLDKTIKSGFETMFQKTRHVMACHYSEPGKEFPCAGWLHNQLGPGNNIGVRLSVMTGQMPPPEVDGPQYETFEETLCNTPRVGKTTKTSSTKRSAGATGRSAGSTRSTATTGATRTASRSRPKRRPA